eukprot:5030862-Prymnesium_polylepis.1
MADRDSIGGSAFTWRSRVGPRRCTVRGFGGPFPGRPSMSTVLVALCGVRAALDTVLSTAAAFSVDVL